MQSSDVARIVGILLAIGLVVFVVAQIARFARTSSSDSINGDSAGVVEGSISELAEYADSKSKVIMVHSGRILAKEYHRKIKITVTEKARKLEIIRGYDGKVLNRYKYDNTAKSYEAFLKSLDFYGFLNRQNGEYGDDEVGVCPKSAQTIVHLFDNGQSVERLWSTTCDRDYGTLAGNSRRIMEMFKSQIPDYRTHIRGVRL